MSDTGALYEKRYGSNQHNNQLIYYIRDIKVLGAAHSYSLDDQISGAAFGVSCSDSGRPVAAAVSPMV